MATCEYQGIINIAVENGAANPPLGFPLQGDVNSIDPIFYVNASAFGITGTSIGRNKIMRSFTCARFYPGGVSTITVTGSNPPAYSGESTPMVFFRGRGFATASPLAQVAQGTGAHNSIPIITLDVPDATKNYSFNSPAARMLSYNKPSGVMDFDIQQDSPSVLSLGNNRWCWGWRNPVNSFVSAVSLGIYSQELEQSGFQFQPLMSLPFSLVGSSKPAFSADLSTGLNYMINGNGADTYLYIFRIDLINKVVVGTQFGPIVLDNGVGSIKGASLLKGTPQGFIVSTSNRTLSPSGYLFVTPDMTQYWGLQFVPNGKATSVSSINNIRTPILDEFGRWWIQQTTDAGHIFTSFKQFSDTSDFSATLPETPIPFPLPCFTPYEISMIKCKG